MEQEKSAVVQARELAVEAEEASLRGDLVEAVIRYTQAGELFQKASRQTTDIQSVQALTLLAQTNRQKADELQLYLDAMATNFNNTQDGEGWGTHSLTGNGYLYDSEISFGGTGATSGKTLNDSVNWGGEDSMVYARSSSPFSIGGGAPPIYFVFTKSHPHDNDSDEEEELEEEEVSFPESGDDASPPETDGISGAWQMMVKGMEQLLDILPRPVLAGPSSSELDSSRSQASQQSSSPQSPSQQLDDPRRKLLSYADRGVGKQEVTKNPFLSLPANPREKEESGDAADDFERSVTESFFMVPSSSPPRKTGSSMTPSPKTDAGRIISPVPRSAASCPTLPVKSSPIRMPHPHPPRSHPLPFISSSFPPSPKSPEPKDKPDESALSRELAEAKQEIVKMRNIIEALTAENEKLTKRHENEDVGNVQKENEMLKQSILRFRTEFSKQTQHMRRRKLQVPHGAHQIHHSLRLSRKPIDNTSEMNPLSYSSTASPSASPAQLGSSAKGMTTRENPSATISSQLLAPTLELSPQNLELAFKNLAGRYERQLRDLAEESAHYRAVLRSTEGKLRAMSDENVKQAKTIREYDAKWKKLEQSARQKLQQKKTGSPFSPATSTEFSTSPSSPSFPANYNQHL